MCVFCVFVRAASYFMFFVVVVVCRSGNEIGSHGCRALVEALKSNKTVASLNLAGEYMH